MEKRKLGKSGLEFAPIAFGGNVFGWTADEATSHRLLDAFVDAGFSFIDTADVYSRWYPGNKGGESEAIIGTWLKKNPAKRDKVQIATKCGMVPADGALKRDHIKWSVDESLKRLNTDIELLRKTVKKIGLDMMNEPQWQKELLQPLKMQGLVDIKDASLIVRFKFTARPKNPSMVQRMAIRRMYETLPKLGIEFARPPYANFPFGGIDPAARQAAQ